MSTQTAMPPHNPNDVILVTDTQRRKKQRKIPPELRKKVAQACDQCKKRKQKCDGALPCGSCQRRVLSCTYNSIDRRVLRPSKKELERRREIQQLKQQQLDPQQHLDSQQLQQHNNPTNDHPHTTDGSSSDYSYASNQVHVGIMSHSNQHQQQSQQSPKYMISVNNIPSVLQPLLNFPFEYSDDQIDGSDVVSSVENGQNSRLLFDAEGNLRYIGESSSLSFLLQCRKVFQRILGPSKFTQESDKFNLVDMSNERPSKIPVGLPDKAYSEHLLELFKRNVNDLVYVYDEEKLDNWFHHIYDLNEKNAAPRSDMCLIFLILAVGSLFAVSEIKRNVFPFKESFYIDSFILLENAKDILRDSPDDGGIWIVEAYFLKSFYYQNFGRRSTAWMNLGIAIRYALSLGLHRKYINESFSDPLYVLHRRKLFRSLFIMDRISSVHLGQCLTINDQEWDDQSSLKHIDDKQNELFEVLVIVGKILRNVYFNPSINWKTALQLAVELKNFKLNSSIDKSVQADNNNHSMLFLHLSHLCGVILLGRPFFHFVILKKLGLLSFNSNSKTITNVMKFYVACAKASLLTIKLLEYYYTNNIHPLRPFVLLVATFHAGLIIGSILLLRAKNINDEIFSENEIGELQISGSSLMIWVSGMNTAITILRSYGDVDQAYLRLSEILRNMLEVDEIKKMVHIELNKHQQMRSVHIEKKGSIISSMVPDKLETSSNNPQDLSGFLKFGEWLFPSFSQQSSELSYESNSQVSDERLLNDLAAGDLPRHDGQLLLDMIYNVGDSNNNSAPPNVETTQQHQSQRQNQHQNQHQHQHQNQHQHQHQHQHQQHQNQQHDRSNLGFNPFS